MDVNAMCLRYWPRAGLKHFTVKKDMSGVEGWVALAGGWAFFEGPDAPPSAADVLAKEAEYETYLDEERAKAPKTLVENELRNDPTRLAMVKREAKNTGKTVDEVIAEIVAEV